MAPHGAPLAPAITPPDTSSHVEQARAVLEEQRTLLGEGVDVEVEVLAETSVPKTVAHYAAAHDVDLIALSTHGHTGFRHLVLGSVAESILRHSEVPVLTFPQPKTPKK